MIKCHEIPISGKMNEQPLPCAPSLNHCGQLGNCWVNQHLDALVKILKFSRLLFNQVNMKYPRYQVLVHPGCEGTGNKWKTVAYPPTIHPSRRFSGCYFTLAVSCKCIPTIITTITPNTSRSSTNMSIQYIQYTISYAMHSTPVLILDHTPKEHSVPVVL